MIGRGFRRARPSGESDPTVEAQGFDAYELRLGDMMRGERATMGKSLLDVQRELKIKAAYIAAIENADPTAFDTPGFIAGYVRSYARYLTMDPDWAFEMFCRESGFQTAHGMSSEASSLKGRGDVAGSTPMGRDIFSASATPYIPEGETMLANIEPRAVGSILILLALISGLGYGGYSVLQEVQRVQFAPVEQAPTVLAEVDPLARGSVGLQAPASPQASDVILPNAEALDRLYRPNPLDIPVMTQRDGPIVAINTPPEALFADTDAEPDPSDFAQSDPAGPEATSPIGPVQPVSDDVIAQVIGDVTGAGTVQVTEEPSAQVSVVAVREAWVRVRGADGTTLFESVMQPGDTFEVPQTEAPPTIRIGESGAIYFSMNGAHYGPAGARGQVTSNLALSVSQLTAQFDVADLDDDSDLAEVVRFASIENGDAVEDATQE